MRPFTSLFVFDVGEAATVETDDAHIDSDQLQGTWGSVPELAIFAIEETNLSTRMTSNKISTEAIILGTSNFLCKILRFVAQTNFTDVKQFLYTLRIP
jgi:hypothetical protein